MLNISNTSISKRFDLLDFKSGKHISNKKYYRSFNKISLVFLVIVIIIHFLPWTQNIIGKGQVTTLQPDHRPQNIQSPIPGRIEEWFVREGDYVQKGDTILRISEIKSEYFDDKLLERTRSQIQSKSQSIQAYTEKTKALQNKIDALNKEQELKLKQANNKLLQAQLMVLSDSVDLEAAVTNLSIAETQYERVKTLQEEGLKATKDVEEKRLKLQATNAKYISQQNKLLKSKNEVINAEIELSSIRTSYIDKISKAQSDLQTALSMQFNTEAEVMKLENSFSNYSRRNELLFVTAPQHGFINKAIKGGIGENFKEGENLVAIMPSDYDLAVETFVRPIDLPLVHIGGKVRVQFDGWPAIVFSGWESISYGTYGAKIVAVENFISPNGMYRILLAPDEEDHQWPEGIRVGSGVRTIALLNDVPIWYELWRQTNGFPPDFYTPQNTNDKKK